MSTNSHPYFLGLELEAQSDLQASNQTEPDIMWKALFFAGLACVLAEEDGQDGSCMLQAQAHGKDKVAMIEAKQMKAELKQALHQKTWNKGFCKGEPLTEFNFNGFSHGTEAGIGMRRSATD